MTGRQAPSADAVTVVIPTRDRVDMLGDAVASVLDQRAVPVEVVVVDDASSDGTESWLREHPDPRVRFVRLMPARERTVARNIGLREARTPFVLFLDDDDMLAPDALVRLTRALARHPTAPLAAGTYATFGNHGTNDVPRRQPIGRLPIARRMWREILWGWYLLPGCALWRTDELRALGGWDETRTFAEDLELSLRIHPRPMALTPHVVLRYRLHDRYVDPATRARQEAMNDAVRTHFLDGLPPRERRVGRGVVEARPVFVQAFADYSAGHYRRFAAGVLGGLRRAPSLAASPVVAPMLVAMMVKGAVASALPGAVRGRVRARRRTVRAARFGSGPT